MDAMYWHQRVPTEPRLRHADGFVTVDFDGRQVVFPSEAAARFFYAAYTEMPSLSARLGALKEKMDEDAYTQAVERVVDLEKQLERLQQENFQLKVQLETQSRMCDEFKQRATILGASLRRAQAGRRGR